MHSHSRPRLIRGLAHVPVTALALHRAPCGRLFALAGIDTAVVVYDAGAEAGEDADLDADSDGAALAGVRWPVCSIPVFASQPIHGIQVRACGGLCTVLVWGAREVAVFSADGLFKENHHHVDDAGANEEERPRALPAVVRATAPDWICDGALSPYDPHIAMLATAHNEAVELRFDPAARRITLGAPVCPARPMLFTARVAWESEHAVLVAGGTVFGHILVWRYRIQGRGGRGAAAAAAAATESLLDLQGFEGSIFGVDVSPLMPLADGSAVRLLAGCSDDRTIRVWDITERAGSSANGSHFDQQDIDTGFGGNFDEADGGEEGPGVAAARGSGTGPAPVAVVGMGHASRIWGVRFAHAPCGPDATLAMYSFGEDAVTQRWLLTLSRKAEAAGSAAADADPKPLTGKLSQDQAYSLHHGKHLWSHAMLAEDDGMSIATGGADSQINIIQRRPLARERTASSVSSGSAVLDVGDILRSVASPTSPAAAKEIIGRYDFLTHDQILVTTNQGRILLGSLRGGGDWQEVAVDRAVAETLRSCYVLRTIADGAALLGTTRGEIFLFQLSTKEIRRVAALPGKIVDMSRLSAKKPGAEDVVGVLVFLHGHADSHLLTIDLSCGSLQSQEQIRGLDPRFVATSAAMISGMIIVGSRHGWLSILKRDVEGETYRPVLDLATRSFDSITAIVPLPQKQSRAAEETSPYILVTSKDGKYRIYEIVQGEADSLRLALRHETSPPFGPVITDAWFTSGPAPELMLSGFRSKAFVIWNESRKEELANVDCGGAHRTFQLVYDEQDASRYRFAFTKTSKLSLHSADQAAHRSLKTGVHGREIKALSSNGRYIASGAEDTTIRIWEHHPEREGTGAEMSCVATMKAHVTGIQRLAWFEGDYLFSSAGNEEFFVWRVRELDSSYRGLAVFCEAEFENKSAEGDLRIMDFDVLRHEDGAIIITMAFSNSTLKTFRYTSGDKGRFELAAEGSYTGACLTQIRHLSVQGDVLHILAASTDGHLTVWRAFSERGTYALEEASQLHQNSIKSLDLLDDFEGGYLVLTGGDDNAVGVARVEQGTDQGWQTAGRGVVRKAHAAAVTGVALVRRGRDVFGVSSGNDQSVKAWRIAGGQSSRIALVGEASTGVADVGDLALLRSSTSPRATFVVAGVGMEMWNLLLE